MLIKYFFSSTGNNARLPGNLKRYYFLMLFFYSRLLLLFVPSLAFQTIAVTFITNKQMHLVVSVYTDFIVLYINIFIPIFLILC